MPLYFPLKSIHINHPNTNSSIKTYHANTNSSIKQKNKSQKKFLFEKKSISFSNQLKK